MNLRTLRIQVLFLFLLGFIDATGQQTRQIEILNADIIKSDRIDGQSVQKLLGNVNFKHEEALMSCDSAYYYSQTRSFDAFGNVEMEQGDTLYLYGDRVNYDGQTRFARIRENVKLIDDSTVLVTDYLDYDRNRELAFYLSGGVITEGENELRSDQGYYYMQSEIFHFKDSVVVINPDYTIYSDTLHYNTSTGFTTFFGPTEIHGTENYLYCEGGWYDTEKDVSKMHTNALLKRDEQTLTADTLYYERSTGFGEGRSNVVLYDSIQDLTLKGNFAHYYEREDRAMLTDSAWMVQVQDVDTLFLHADTLRSIPDTATRGQTNILLAYHKVKFYRPDLQGMCDSLVYLENDSAMHMYVDPLLWTAENQIKASKIEVVSRNEELHRLYLRNIALLISFEDSARYNQIRGKSMIGYFRDNQLYQLDVTGNGQSIYWAEDQGEIIGVNRSECTDLQIFLKDNQVYRVKYLVKPTGVYYPLGMLPENRRYLDGYSWDEEWRPHSWEEIFFWK